MIMFESLNLKPFLLLLQKLNLKIDICKWQNGFIFANLTFVMVKEMAADSKIQT